MFGSNKHPETDKLSVQVHVVASAAAFQLGQKLWEENARTLHTDPASGKEFLHFVYANPPSVVWMQRTPGGPDYFELIVRWEKDAMHEVYVIQNSAQPAGDDGRAKELLQSILTTPSIVLAKDGGV